VEASEAMQASAPSEDHGDRESYNAGENCRGDAISGVRECDERDEKRDETNRRLNFAST
jgi:hypothetical protein